MNSLNKYSLIACCGMNCGYCMAYLRDKNNCPGCRAENVKKPITRTRCKIKNCKVFHTSKAKFCYECKDFPCGNLKHLDNRYRTKYNMSMVENLENIKNYGIKMFIRKEDKRWACPECKGRVSIHTGKCVECGVGKGIF